MEQFQGPGACLVVERSIREGTDDASQEKGQSCLFVLERYHEGSKPSPPFITAHYTGVGWIFTMIHQYRQKSFKIN